MKDYTDNIGKIAIITMFVSVFLFLIALFGYLFTSIHILDEKEKKYLADVATFSYENDFSQILVEEEIKKIRLDDEITDEMKTVLTNPESYDVQFKEGLITVRLNGNFYIGEVMLDTKNNMEISFSDDEERVIVLGVLLYFSIALFIFLVCTFCLYIIEEGNFKSEQRIRDIISDYYTY